LGSAAELQMHFFRAVSSDFKPVLILSSSCNDLFKMFKV